MHKFKSSSVHEFEIPIKLKHEDLKICTIIPSTLETDAYTVKKGTSKEVRKKFLKG